MRVWKTLHLKEMGMQCHTANETTVRADAFTITEVPGLGFEIVPRGPMFAGYGAVIPWTHVRSAEFEVKVKEEPKPAVEVIRRR